MNTPRRFLLSAAILTLLLACGRGADLTSKQRVDIGRIYGAKSKNPSSTDVQACLDFGRGTSEWNRITAPVVRDLLDPQITREEWAHSTTAAMPQMRAVVMKMLASARLVSDEGIAKTLLPLAEVHREMLDAYTLIAFAASAGEKAKVAELTSGLRTLGEKKTALGISVVQRTREYLGPESFDKALDEHVKVSSSSAQNAETARTVDQSSAEAQSKLGWMYATGNGVQQDDTEAVKWYRKAAEQGDADAQFNLGNKYRYGDGVPKDFAEAAKWFRKAAYQGKDVAQLYLGWRYYNGEGVPKDLVQAHVWWNIAGAAGCEYSKKDLAMVEKEMTPDQKAEAMKLARELFAKLPKKK